MQLWCVPVTYTRRTPGKASRAESDSQQAARLATRQVLSQALLRRSRSTDSRTTQLYGRMVCPHHCAAAAAVQMGVTVAGSVSCDEVPESDTLAGHSRHKKQAADSFNGKVCAGLAYVSACDDTNGSIHVPCAVKPRGGGFASGCAHRTSMHQQQQMADVIILKSARAAGLLQLPAREATSVYQARTFTRPDQPAPLLVEANPAARLATLRLIVLGGLS